MVFVNYCAGLEAIPYWLKHAPPGRDAYTPVDLVFPAFLFMSGLAIPLSLGPRLKREEPRSAILGKVTIRVLSLLFLGAVTASLENYSEQASGMSQPLWTFLFYAGVILLWRAGSGRGSRLLGLGILGIIGWAYGVCAAVYVAAKGKTQVLFGALILMLVYYLARTPLGDLLGSQAAIAMAGVLVGSHFVPERSRSPAAKFSFMVFLGLGLWLSGSLLRPWQGISKDEATASFALVTAGEACALFAAFYWLCDVKDWGKKRACRYDLGFCFIF